MKKDKKKPIKTIKIEQRPLTLEDVIGWVEDLEKRINWIEKRIPE